MKRRSSRQQREQKKYITIYICDITSENNNLKLHCDAVKIFNIYSNNNKKKKENRKQNKTKQKEEEENIICGDVCVAATPYSGWLL